jgi:hypothetical protein
VIAGSLPDMADCLGNDECDSNPPISIWTSAQIAARLQCFKHGLRDENRSLPTDDSELVSVRGF